MLAYQTKQDDLKTYQDILVILEIGVRAYLRTGDESFKEEIGRLDAWATELKAKIDSHDYTEEEKRLNHAISLSTHSLAL